MQVGDNKPTFNSKHSVNTTLPPQYGSTSLTTSLSVCTKLVSYASVLFNKFAGIKNKQWMFSVKDE